MGKPTGFLEYPRELPLAEAPAERVHHWREFHAHADTQKLQIQGARLLDIPEVGRRLDICDKTVRRFIARGDLHAYRVGRQLRISEEELLLFLELRRR